MGQKLFLINIVSVIQLIFLFFFKWEFYADSGPLENWGIDQMKFTAENTLFKVCAKYSFQAFVIALWTPVHHCHQ